MFLLLATPSQFFSWPGRAGLDKPDIVGCSGPQAMSKINTNINGSNTTTWSYAATHDVPDLRLAACDQDPLCGADNYYESERGHCLLTIGIADPKANSFIHLTRCSKSTTAGNYTSLTGGLYKHCDEGGQMASFRLLHTYQIPPALCEAECQSEPSCVAYTIKGDDCLLYTNYRDGYRTSLWFKIPK
jgi:hypothetical protein